QAIWMFPEQRLNYCRFYDVVNESANSFGWIFSMFLKIVNNYASKVFFTDKDSAIIKAVDQIFQPFGTKHVLCLWHLLKNVMKNLNRVLEYDWSTFIKFFYKCFDEYEEDNFIKKWEQLKAPCYNRQMFMADMTTTQRGESMNNLMKGYLDAMTSLTVFLKAFESALEQRKETTEFTKYQEKNEIIKLVTSSPYEKQASELLTKYAIKKTQQQLLEFMIYKCEIINKWRKDPDERTLIRTYKTFYNTSIIPSQQINIEEDNDDYEYLLKRTWRKVQDIINTKPEMVKSFYNSFDKILQEEIKAHVSDNNSVPLTKNQIKNPSIIKSKGRTSNKRILSRFETTKSSKSSKKRILEPNLQNTNEIFLDNIEENDEENDKIVIDSKSVNFQSSFKDHSIKENIQTRNSPCPFCADLLPNPLPEKIHSLLRKIANQNGTPTSEDKLTFCEIHQAETTIVPDGIQKGYPMQIDFGSLETRIFQMKMELLDIINGKANSYYRDFALKICNEIGSRKASTPMALMARFEVLRVLVPETALRLISQDKGGLELELARKIMKDSANFGDYIHSE
ncbi:35191_t:CDS:2, partial [Gigaspora margarita]